MVSGPDVEAVIKDAEAKAKAAETAVAAAEAELAEADTAESAADAVPDDPRIADLARLGVSADAAQALIASMW